MRICIDLMWWNHAANITLDSQVSLELQNYWSCSQDPTAARRDPKTRTSYLEAWDIDMVFRYSGGVEVGGGESISLSSCRVVDITYCRHFFRCFCTLMVLPLLKLLADRVTLVCDWMQDLRGNPQSFGIWLGSAVPSATCSPIDCCAGSSPPGSTHLTFPHIAPVSGRHTWRGMAQSTSWWSHFSWTHHR